MSQGFTRIITRFIQLLDVPSSYSGEANRVVGVKSDETGLEFQTASQTRTNIGATTVGGNIFTLTDPSAIRYLRINADNSVTALTLSQLQTDLGISGVDTAYTDFSGAGGCNAQGFSALTDNSLRYKQIGKTVDVIVRIVGTSNAASFTFTLPVSVNATLTNNRIVASISSNSTQQAGVITISGTTATVTLANINAVASTGNKNCIANFLYESA